MKNLKNFIQFNENLGDDYPETDLQIQDDFEKEPIKIYTVEELYDVDRDGETIPVILVRDLSDEQKEYLGLPLE